MKNQFLLPSVRWLITLSCQSSALENDLRSMNHSAIFLRQQHPYRLFLNPGRVAR